VWQRLGRHAAERIAAAAGKVIVAENDEAREALENAETENEGQDGETGDTDAEEAEAEETSNHGGDSGGATEESAAEQIAALAARIDGIATEISEIRRWFKMTTVDNGESEEGPDDLSFDALADFIIGEG